MWKKPKSVKLFLKQSLLKAFYGAEVMCGSVLPTNNSGCMS